MPETQTLHQLQITGTEPEAPNHTPGRARLASLQLASSSRALGYC